MNDREKQILKILRRNPLIQQNEIADILQISRSRVAAHIMDLMRKGMIKGKGYILTEQDYCVVVGAINMDIRGVADIHYPQAASNPGSIHCSAGGVGRNIAHNLALLGRDVHLISAVGSDFYGETLLEQTRQAGVNVSSCIRLHGHNTSTYLSIANQQEETVLAINDTHILQQLTPFYQHMAEHQTLREFLQFTSIAFFQIHNFGLSKRQHIACGHFHLTQHGRNSDGQAFFPFRVAFRHFNQQGHGDMATCLFNERRSAAIFVQRIARTYNRRHKIAFAAVGLHLQLVTRNPHFAQTQRLEIRQLLQFALQGMHRAQPCRHRGKTNAVRAAHRVGIVNADVWYQ